MGLETGNFVNDLVITNPLGVLPDTKSQGDDHLRLIKTVLKTSFAGFAGAIVITGTDTGAANAYVLTPTPALPSYQSGMLVLLKPANASTGVSTINISSLGAKTIKTLEGASIDANDLLVGTYYWLVYDGTDFRIVGAPTKRYVDALAFSTVLPDQTGNSGKYLRTNGTTASWIDPFASPVLTGVPTAPTAAAGTSTTQIANTEFATTAVAGHFKIAGAATPQQAAFGTASAADTGYLTSTAHATKGKWFLNSAGTITADEANVRFGVGIAAPVSALHVSGPDIVDSGAKYQLAIDGTGAYSTAPAAGLVFGVKYNAAGTVVRGASIQGRKENATDGNFAQGLVFTTIPDGGSPSIRAVLSSAGNLGINETSPDYKLDVNGTFGFTPGTSVTPVDNGDIVLEFTSNTTFTIKGKGSDGVVRSGTVTLA